MQNEIPAARAVSLPGRLGGRISRNRRDLAILATVFVVTIVFHLLTSARTVTFSDSGDFLMGIEAVGNIHGPGYPLYLLTAGLFGRVFPFGSLAFRVSVYSGLFAALTACLMYWIVFWMYKSRLGGVVGALAFTFSYTFWYETVIPETYSLNTFFLALLILLGLRWERQLAWGEREKAANTLCLFAFCFGLALTNHVSIFFTLPAFLFFAVDTDAGAAFSPRNLIRAVLFLCLALVLYIYEPAAAFRGPAYNYGDPATLRDWFRHVTVYYQRGGLFSYPWLLFPGRFWRYFGTLATEFPYFAWLGGAGFLLSFKKRSKKYPLFLLFLFLLTLLPVMTYSQIESVLRAHFYYSSYFVFALWIGVGVAYLARFVREWSLCADRMVRLAAACVTGLLVLLCPLSSIAIHYDKVDKSEYYYAEDMARNMLETARKNGVMITDSDNVIFPCLYLQMTDDVRRDVRVIGARAIGTPGFAGRDLLERTPPGFRKPREDGGGGVVHEIIERNFFDLAVYTPIPTLDTRGWRVAHEGYLLRILPEGSEIDAVDVGPTGLRGEGTPSYKDSDARWAILLPDALEANAHYSRSEFTDASAVYRRITGRFQDNMYVPTLYGCASFSVLYDLWGTSLNSVGMYEETVEHLPGAYEINPDFASLSLGVAYTRSGDPASAADVLEKYVALAPGVAEGHAALGEAYFALGRYDDAAGQVEKAIGLKEGFAGAHFLLGRILFLAGDHPGAAGEFERVIEIDEGGDLAWQAGEFLRLLGQPRR